MTEQDRILQILQEEGKIAITFRELHNINFFKSGKDVASVESLLLTVSGHQPIKRYDFDTEIFNNWCNEHKIESYVDEMNRIVYLRLNRETW